MTDPLIEKLLMAQVTEQRRARRWTMVRRLLSLLVLLWITWMVFSRGPGLQGSDVINGPHTAVIDISGVIEAEGESDGFMVSEALADAFETKEAKGIVLRINSPGGSPVQAGMIFDEIRRLKKAYPDKPVMAVVEDVAASGGYYIAAAADQIYVNQASLIGSIGVRMDSFGFTEAMKKLGIERRLLTAGQNKAMLDPFLPQKPEHQQVMRSLMAEVHAQFIEAVKQGRGDRLKLVAGQPDDKAEVFSGMVYTGTKGIQLGLADGLGTVQSVARDQIKAETLVDYSVSPTLAERLAQRFGASMAQTLFGLMRSSGASPHLGY
ncbi:S49 family peptidase [Betaproteobacteria bacterium LSUCC0115]|nr:S49 family peptidase [Burkholderiales bacterium LSUCC0115]